MNNILNWIVIITFVFLFGYVIISNRKYDNLQNEYEQLRRENTSQYDSLLNLQKERESKIKILENNIIILENDLDSLEQIKRNIENSKKFEVSSTFSEGVVLLKNNLKCENLF